MLLSALTTAGEKFSVGGITTLLGLGMTFIVLALLIGSIYLVNLIIKGLGIGIEKMKESKKAKQTAEAKDEAVSSPVEETKTENAPSEETLIAIEAAVRTYLRESDGAHEHIKIKSVTKL